MRADFSARVVPPARRIGAAVVLTALAAGCASDAASQALRPDRSVTLRGHTLAVHLAAGAAHRAGPLLLYATGDGGWPGNEALFDRMMPWGYPMAAFS